MPSPTSVRNGSPNWSSVFPGARPPRAMDDRADRVLLAQITQRLNKLESQFRATPTIRLTAINPGALLGQLSLLIAELKDSEGRPLVNRELTLVTTWGRVEGRVGVRSVEGNSITVLSDHLGLCKVRVAAAPGEQLSPVESASLGSALALLGTPGDSPRDSLAELTELARRYRAESGIALRRAVDVYYRRYGDTSLTSVPIDSLASWPSIGITVVAWLTPEPGEPTTQIPTGLLRLHQRNWFYAWLWAYRQLLESESTLGASLGDVRSDGAQRRRDPGRPLRPCRKLRREPKGSGRTRARTGLCGHPAERIPADLADQAAGR